MAAINTLLVIVFLFVLGRLGLGLVHPKHKTFTKRHGDDVTRRKISKRLAPALIALFVAIGITAPTHADTGVKPAATPVVQTTINMPAAKPAPVVTTKSETVVQPIAFAKQTNDSSALASGTTKVTQAGVDGERTITYTVTFTDGKETGRVVMSDTVTKQPVAEITTRGTYVAPAPQPAASAPSSSAVPAPSGGSSSSPTCGNGSYVNSAGTTVCRPSAGAGVPAGATARCADGEYSFSQSRRGTCSSHGGVAEWL